MSNLDETILDAAFSVIQRYGVKRTTMSDFAEAAGVSRQTVYARYANKDELLRAITRRMIDKLHDNIMAAAHLTNMSEKLDAVFQHMVIQPSEMLSASPEAADIMLGITAVAKDEIEAGYVKIRAALRDVFLPFERELKAHGVTPDSLAGFLKTSTSAIKETAKDKDEMLIQLGVLKAMLLAVLDTS